MTTQFINRVAVEVDGEGETVVCLHGLGGSSNNWTPIMDAFAGMRTVRIDLPGSARSHRVEGELSISSMAAVVQQVCNRLDITRAHFVGHSLGTIVCFELASTVPALVRSLALFGPLLSPPEAARPNIRLRGERARAEGEAGVQAIADAVVSGALSGETRARRQVAVALVRESLMRQSPDGYARSCEALASAQPAAVERIACPVLLVTGDEDAVAPPQAVRGIAARLPGSRVEIYPRCGHWTTFERPEECLRDLKRFYSGRFQ